MTRPQSIDELSEFLRASSSSLRIVGRDTLGCFRTPSEVRDELGIAGISGIVRFDDLDQVVVVRAGTTLAELNEELGRKGQTIPYRPGLIAEGASRNELDGTVGGALSMNLPNSLESAVGSWRDWILGMTVVLADGTEAKCGSQVVKSVAGYDVHKLFVGARGTLGVVATVALRTTPIAAVPAAVIESHGERSAASGYVLRTLRSELGSFEQRVNSKTYSLDRETATFQVGAAPDEPIPYDGEGWWLRWGCGGRNVEMRDIATAKRMGRAKAIFDSEGRLNPGEMGD